MRYFIYGVCYNTREGAITLTSAGIFRKEFPSLDFLKSNYQQLIGNGIYNVVITSISELSKEDYKTFWGEDVKTIYN